jgi:tetratricopeptide (TPR) repeat protein
MLAFGLEENGDYPAAIDAGMRALADVPDNSWAIHAIAHCHEMRGEREKGIRWLGDTAAQWQDNALLAVHNWWHLALFHLGLGDRDAAIAIYDNHIHPAAGAPAIELVDASAMLWRLQLAGAAIGDRFAAVSDAWDQAFAGPDAHGHYGFNDLHAAMAHAGAGRLERATPHLADLSLRAASAAPHARVLALAGLPLVRAIYAFAAGDHALAADLLWRHSDPAIQLGGSDAQRDILRLTLLAAAADTHALHPVAA